MKPLHIDDDIQILTDEAAKEALAKDNDASFVSEEQGITHVPLDRWQKAQRAERKHWMVRGLHVSNDRNDDHMTLFDDYATLRDRHFQHALEMGCGPFTNLSLIGTVCEIDDVTLLDPLIESYLSHPFCNYTHEKFFLRRQNPIDLFMRRVLGRIAPSLYKTLARNLIPRKTIPVRGLIATPIETMPRSDTPYDLIVIINVIEHCYDIDRVFQQIVDNLAPGGILVFHDKYYSHDAVAETVKVQYDAAHPLKVDRKVIDSFLDAHFNDLYRYIATETSHFRDYTFQYDMLYLIGQKKQIAG